MLGTSKIVLQGTLDLAGLLGTLQTSLHATLDFKGLLQTLKTGSQATLHLTGLVGTLQTGLLAKSGLIKLQEITLTDLRATKEFADLWIIAFWIGTDWLLLLETLADDQCLNGGK